MCTGKSENQRTTTGCCETGAGFVRGPVVCISMNKKKTFAREAWRQHHPLARQVGAAAAAYPWRDSVQITHLARVSGMRRVCMQVFR